MDNKNFLEISPFDLILTPFKNLHKDWMLITSKKEEKVNGMTASWGGFGVYAHRPVVNIYIRPQRLTNDFVNASNKFTLCFFDEKNREPLNYLGKTSGHTVPDKMEKCGLTAINIDDEPAFNEAELIITCKTIYKTKIDPNQFFDKTIPDEIYPNKDYHNIYLAEILKVYIKKSGRFNL